MLGLGGFDGVGTVLLVSDRGAKTVWDGWVWGLARSLLRSPGGSRAAVALWRMLWALSSCRPVFSGRLTSFVGQRRGVLCRSAVAEALQTGHHLCRFGSASAQKPECLPHPHTALPASTPVPRSSTWCALFSSGGFILLS